MIHSLLVILIFLAEVMADDAIYTHRPALANGNTGPYLLKTVFPKKFAHASKKFCDEQRPLRLALIVIPSKPTHFQHRASIRATWGSKGTNYSMPVVFILGLSPESLIQQKVYMEMKKFNDIILASFTDTYRNLTLKTVSILQWVLDYCYISEFVIKVDDDVFINIPSLKIFLQNMNPYKAVIYGTPFTNGSPERDESIKVYVSTNDYKREKYPPYVSGGIYIMPTMIIKFLYDAALEEQFFPIEDVFLTGFVAKRLGIKINRIKGIIYADNARKFAYLFKAIISVTEVEPSKQYYFNKMVKY